jgi:hypothetical protein
MEKAEPREPETVSGYYVKMYHAGSGAIVLSDAVITEYADVAWRKALDHLEAITQPHGTHLRGAFVVRLTPTELTVHA